MTTFTDGKELVDVPSAVDWRDWLLMNHDQSKGIWLVYYKKGSGKPTLSYDEAVDEAICFGWIDSKPNKLDDERSVQFFAPRNPKSNWSKINKERVQRLAQQGKLAQAGLAVIEAAKQNGAWDALNEVEELLIPDDLAQALATNSDASNYFSNFPKSSKRNILEWIHNAKQADTRTKRIAETVELAAQNIRANHYRQPKGK